MHRIDTPTALKDKFGQGKNGFTNGDPSTGRRATDLDSDMWDAVQEEICNVIEKSGAALNKTQKDQLYNAIVRLITDRVPDALLRKNNLSDVIDKALARSNLELGSAATKDVQQNTDDTTQGRILINGNAIAVRSVRAKAGEAIADANALPANSVSFCYASATNSPGYEATILDVAGLSQGYRVQYAASYADGGKNLRFRVRNGDNGTWSSSWTRVLTNYGGSVDYLDGAKYYSTKPEYWQGSGAFANQYKDGSAPFFVGGYSTPKDVSIYLPIVKGTSQTSGYGYGASVSFGILRSGKADFGSAVIHVIGDNGSGATFDFSANGTFSAGGGNIIAGQGLYESGGRVRAYSSNNPPPQPDLSPYATTDWTMRYFVRDVALGAEGSFVVQRNGWQRVPGGCAMTGYNFEGENPGGDTIFYRPIQKYMSYIGWITVGHTA
ncbi:TPA: hypothetical protein ACOEF8_002017 [Enterobacter roggenkampii]